MIALLVGIINGIFDIAYNMQRTFEASVTNDYGESLSVKVIADSGRPPFLWYLAWRVGSNPVTTVNIGVTITPSGTNVGNLKVTYYIKGVSGSNSKKFLSATSLSATSGQQITNSTGNIDIDTHLASLGLSTTQDQTVNYKIYCKVEGTGLISGDTLIVEVTETTFDTILYDYGTQTTKSWTEVRYYKDGGEPIYSYDITAGKRDITPFGTYTSCVGYDGSDHRWEIIFRMKNVGIPQGSQIVSASVEVYLDTYSDVGTKIGIKALDEVDPTVPTDPTDLASRPKTDAYETYNTNNFDAEDPLPVKAPLQEVVNRADWYSGATIAFYLYPITGADKGYFEFGYYYWGRTLTVTYVDSSASWNWFNLPLSIVSLPIGQQFIAILFMILVFVVWVVSREKKRSKGRRRR